MRPAGIEPRAHLGVERGPLRQLAKRPRAHGVHAAPGQRGGGQHRRDARLRGHVLGDRLLLRALQQVHLTQPAYLTAGRAGLQRSGEPAR